MVDVFERVFVSGDRGDAKSSMQAAFEAVLRRSTWYSCQEITKPFGQDELSRLASGMIRYVTQRLDRLYENEELLSAKALECRISVWDLARKLSSEFVSEAVFASVWDHTPNGLREARDRASAACLFHYKYCCIHEKLFLMSWIRRWVKLSLAVDNVVGGVECKLETLLIALQDMESSTDEIAAKKGGNAVTE